MGGSAMGPEPGGREGGCILPAQQAKQSDGWAVSPAHKLGFQGSASAPARVWGARQGN